MKFDVLTLFPEMFKSLEESIIGKAKEKNLIDINLINIRDFSKDKHKKVPEVLLSGHHENIRKWREVQALKNTYQKRPDLLKNKKPHVQFRLTKQCRLAGKKYAVALVLGI